MTKDTNAELQNPLIEQNHQQTLEHCGSVLAFLEAAISGPANGINLSGPEAYGLVKVLETVRHAIANAETAGANVVNLPAGDAS